MKIRTAAWVSLDAFNGLGVGYTLHGKQSTKIQGLLFLNLKFRLWNLSAEEQSFVQNCQRMPAHKTAVFHHAITICKSCATTSNISRSTSTTHPQMFYSFPCVTSFCHQATCLACALSAGRTSSCFAAWVSVRFHNFDLMSRRIKKLHITSAYLHYIYSVFI